MDIQDFYSKFYSANQSNVTTLDLENTFTIHFSFYPFEIQSKKQGKIVSKKPKEHSPSTLAIMRSNLQANLTGGLISKGSSKGVVDLRKSKEGNENTLKSHMGYITKGLQLIDPGSEGTLDLTEYVQQITIPNLQLNGTDNIDTMFGQFSTSGQIVEPENHDLVINVLNTKLPILETLFYPWMRESTSPVWLYDEQPYTTANITVSMRSHADARYYFYNCFPTRIQTYDPTMSLNSQFSRDVTLRFQYMFIKSSLKVRESKKEKLQALGKSMLKSVF